MLRKSLKTIAGQFRHRHTRHRRHSFRPTCERLEARLVLSSLFTASDVIVSSGDPVPDADGSVNGMFDTVSYAPIINDNGQVAFVGYGSQNVDGIYRGDGSLSLTVIAQEGGLINLPQVWR